MLVTSGVGVEAEVSRVVVVPVVPVHFRKTLSMPMTVTQLAGMVDDDC